MSDSEQSFQRDPDGPEPTCSVSESPVDDSSETTDATPAEDSACTLDTDVSLTDAPETSQSPFDHDKTIEDDSSEKTSTKDKRSRELKLLLALSKESNLTTNISHKRKHLQTQRLREYKNASFDIERKVSKQQSDSKNIRFPVTAEAELEHVGDTEVNEACGSPNTSGRIKRKRDSECSVTGGATEEAVKKHRKITAGEVKMFKEHKDMFCWRCHRDGVNIACETCPRAYHQKCLKQTISNPEHWPCPECVSILKAESTQTRSPAMKGMTLEHLCSLLKFAIKRMIQCQGSEPFLNAVSDTDFPEYKKYIVQPMDLAKLEKNIKNNIYGSTQAFEADAKWLLHNSIIFNSYQSKLTTAAKNIVKICKQEMAEIENCPSCYLNANTRKNTWFVEVCPKPHILVWAKLKGFPYWPAKAMQCNSSGMVDVRFFGAHDRAWVHYKDCYLYSEKDPNTFKQKRYDIEKCIEELTVYVENLEKIYGEFRPAPFKTCYDPDNETKQLQIFLPRYKHVRAHMKKYAQNGEVNTETSKTDEDKDGEKSDESTKEGVEEKLEATMTPESEKSRSKEDVKSEDRYSNFSSPVTDDKENLDTTMEGYGTDDDAATDIDMERRKRFRERKTDEIDYEEDDDEDEEDDTQVPNNISVDSPSVRGNVRTRGGHNTTPGKLRFVPRRKSDYDKLKRISTDETPSPHRKVSRRNSDQSVKSDSSRISNISDKINRVDITENMEVSLGNDDISCFSLTGKTSPVSSEVSKSGSEQSVEIKKKPVQVDIDNAEFTISPSNKLKIADKLIKRLSDSSDSNHGGDKVEDVKKNLGLGGKKTQTDVLIERFKGMVDSGVINSKESSETEQEERANIDNNDSVDGESSLKEARNVQKLADGRNSDDVNEEESKISQRETKQTKYVTETEVVCKEMRTKTKAEKKHMELSPPEKSDSDDSEEVNMEEAPRRMKVMIQPSVREFLQSTLPTTVPELGSRQIKEKHENGAKDEVENVGEENNVDEVEPEESDDEKAMVIDETKPEGKSAEDKGGKMDVINQGIDSKIEEETGAQDVINIYQDFEDDAELTSSVVDEIQMQKNKIKDVIHTSLQGTTERNKQANENIEKPLEIEDIAQDKASKALDSAVGKEKTKVPEEHSEGVSEGSDIDRIEAPKQRKYPSRKEVKQGSTRKSGEKDAAPAHQNIDYSDKDGVNKSHSKDSDITLKHSGIARTNLDKESSDADSHKSDETETSDSNKTVNEVPAHINKTDITLASKKYEQAVGTKSTDEGKHEETSQPKKLILKRRRTDEDTLTVRYKVVKVSANVDEGNKPQNDTTNNQSKDDGRSAIAVPVQEMSTGDIKSEPGSDEDSSDNENLAAKMKYLSALNISEKTRVADKKTAKVNEIRTRSKAEEKREKYRALDNVSKIIEEVAMNSSKEDQQKAEKKNNTTAPEGEIYVKSFAKLQGTAPTGTTPPNQQRARKSFPMPTYTKPKTVVLAKKEAQHSPAVTVANKKEVQKVTASTTQSMHSIVVSKATNTTTVSVSAKPTVVKLQSATSGTPGSTVQMSKQQIEANMNGGGMSQIILFPTNTTLAGYSGMVNTLFTAVPSVLASPPSVGAITSQPPPPPQNQQAQSATPVPPQPADGGALPKPNVRASQNYIPQNETNGDPNLPASNPNLILNDLLSQPLSQTLTTAAAATTASQNKTMPVPRLRRDPHIWDHFRKYYRDNVSYSICNFCGNCSISHVTRMRKHLMRSCLLCPKWVRKKYFANYKDEVIKQLRLELSEESEEEQEIMEEDVCDTVIKVEMVGSADEVEMLGVEAPRSESASTQPQCPQPTPEPPDTSTPTPITLTAQAVATPVPPAELPVATPSTTAENQEEDELATLHSVLPESLSRAVSELLLKPPPRLKPRPPGVLSAIFDDGIPSSAGNVTARINSIAHRMGDYFRGMLIETLEDLGKCQNPEARIASLQLEMEALKHKHNLELSEMRNNICTILKDIQKSLSEDRDRIVDETRAACEAETIKRVELAKSKQWCANCSKEAQFYCCWNTSYCDYPCQQKHWPQHMGKCTQNIEKGVGAAPAGGGAATAGQPTVPPQRPPGQQLILRPTTAKPGAQGVGRYVAKPTKVYMNKTPVPQKTFKTLTTTGNHITVIETSPGQFELVGNGPIAVAGKLYSPPGALHPKFKTGGMVAMTPPTAVRQAVPQLSSAPGTSKGQPTIIVDEDN